MLDIRLYSSFKRDYKRAIAQGMDPARLKEVVDLLREEKSLPSTFRDHKLRNDHKYKNMRECHIQSDWLLIYRIEHNELILYLARTGT